MRLKREKMLVSGNDVAVLLRAQAKLRSNVSLLGEELPTAGKELNVASALFLTVNDAGKIARVTRIQESLQVVRQLGIPAQRMLSLIDKLEQHFQE